MRKWDVSRLSKAFQVRLLTAQDAEAVLGLCQGNPRFYHHCPPDATRESILQDMIQLPPRTTPEDKFYIGFYDGKELAAVMDLIRGYPERDAAFVGFFMMEASRQGRGEGSAIIEELCSFLHNQGCRYLRLAWVQGNAQSERFWRKNGFSETGVTIRQDCYTMVAAQRNLT